LSLLDLRSGVTVRAGFPSVMRNGDGSIGSRRVESLNSVCVESSGQFVICSDADGFVYSVHIGSWNLLGSNQVPGSDQIRRMVPYFGRFLCSRRDENAMQCSRFFEIGVDASVNAHVSQNLVNCPAVYGLCYDKRSGVLAVAGISQENERKRRVVNILEANNLAEITSYSI